jgi:protein phosphatase 1G
MISPAPDVRTRRIDPSTDPFMILACDGIWNSMSSQEVVDFVSERIEKKPEKMSSICEEVSFVLSSVFRGDLKS